MATDYFGLTIPFLEHIGVVPLSSGKGRCMARFPLIREVMNSRGEFQGGALMAALDFAMSAAARSAYETDMGAATIDMNCSFIAPAKGDLAVEANVIKAGKSLAFCEGEIRDAQGELVARSTGTFRMLARS
jgi:uncharacterized protein (TIGR00369 family)